MKINLVVSNMLLTVLLLLTANAMASSVCNVDYTKKNYSKIVNCRSGATSLANCKSIANDKVKSVNAGNVNYEAINTVYNEADKECTYMLIQK